MKATAGERRRDRIRMMLCPGRNIMVVRAERGSSTDVTGTCANSCWSAPSSRWPDSIVEACLRRSQSRRNRLTEDAARAFGPYLKSGSAFAKKHFP